jgi:UDP-2,4-diacetamido-2,4,6-trideoxy-beta-L-altropyranose hydrolase
MTALPPLLLRADAGGLLGSGHVMRVIALGQAWVDAGGPCILAAAELPEGLAARARSERSFLVEHLDTPPWSPADASALAALGRRFGAKAAVIDSYKFDPPYLAAIEAAGLKAVAIDDLGAQGAYPCSLLVNPNITGRETLYIGKAHGVPMLLGPRFVMLRREFAQHRASERLIPTQARRLLVTFGGVDPKGASLTALDALARLPDITAQLIIGAANARGDEIAAKAAGVSNVTVVRDARDVAERMMAQEMLLSGGGTTVWEAAALGAPMMLVASAPEEEIAAARLARGGLCQFLGPAEQLTAEGLAEAIWAFAEDMAARAQSSVLGRELVDGYGAERVVDAIKDAIA